MAWPNGPETTDTPREIKSKWWTVKTYHKKNCEQQEYFIQREGPGRIKVTDGFRWCEYRVETNDGEFPKFEFTQVPGGNAAKDSLDMNSLSGSNIESSELVSMDDGGCWGGWEIEGVSEEEEEQLNEFLEENGSWALEDEGEWYLDETEVWVWGPLEVSDDEGNVRIIIADDDGNVTDFKEDIPTMPEAPTLTVEEKVQIIEEVEGHTDLTDWHHKDHYYPTRPGRYQVTSYNSANWPFPTFAEWDGKNWNDDKVISWRGLNNEPSK